MSTAVTSNQSTLPTGVPAEQPPERTGTGDTGKSQSKWAVDDPDYPTGEPVEQDYWFCHAHCVSHPNPGRNILNDEQHFEFSVVAFSASEEYSERLKTVMTPEECSCGGDVKIRERPGEWPPKEITTRGLLNLFRETNGQIVIQFYPRDEERTFYIGEIGGRYLVESVTHESPGLPTGAEDLPKLIENYPNRLVDVDWTPLSGAYEDYRNFED